MKPAFALSFSATGISLHHQSDDDWFCVGEIALDAPDLKDQVRALRDQGFAIANDLSCKLVIPEDQVRYISAPTDGLSDKENEQALKAALAGETPYSVDDLAFSSTTVDATTYVAAVTKQTLVEAQEFATEHGFIPVQFSTDADAQDFPTEPTFSISEPDMSVATPAEVRVPSPEPQAEDAPTVHAIAATTAPDVFRSAPVEASGEAPRPATGLLASRYAIPAAVAAAVLLAVGLGAWTMTGSDTDRYPVSETVQVQEDVPSAEPLVANTQVDPPEATADETTTETAALESPQPDPVTPEPSDLTATDAAILEALNVAPTTVEDVARDPEPQEDPTQPGLQTTAPGAPEIPAEPKTEELYLASVDNSNLSRDAVALPPVDSFATDAPFEPISVPSAVGTNVALDDRGLVTPTAEGTLNPDGIVVYLGRPSKVPPEIPVRFEQEPIEQEPQNPLAELRPKPRPSDLIDRFERQQLGGRTRQELAVLRPKLRPKSVQEQPQVDETPTALAVVRVPRPKPRPAGLAPSSGTQTANLGSTAAITQSDAEAGSFQPRAVAPKIPSSASVARQATIDNALNLRRLNLIGVYGTPANRRALVRLPSGRYKKLKVGDRLDGGKVIAIGDSELRYQKRGKNTTLKMPRG
ncbi:hypothetical protein [Ruegeria meonggei]|uniref:hypothetical protein n=1 Tax=Ruegeria meonggei TaxID=1446476 RepID=UPI003672BDE2